MGEGEQGGSNGTKTLKNDNNSTLSLSTLNPGVNTTREATSTEDKGVAISTESELEKETERIATVAVISTVNPTTGGEGNRRKLTGYCGGSIVMFSTVNPTREGKGSCKKLTGSFAARIEMLNTVNPTTRGEESSSKLTGDCTYSGGWLGESNRSKGQKSGNKNKIVDTGKIEVELVKLEVQTGSKPGEEEVCKLQKLQSTNRRELVESKLEESSNIGVGFSNTAKHSTDKESVDAYNMKLRYMGEIRESNPTKNVELLISEICDEVINQCMVSVECKEIVMECAEIGINILRKNYDTRP